MALSSGSLQHLHRRLPCNNPTVVECIMIILLSQKCYKLYLQVWQSPSLTAASLRNQKLSIDSDKSFHGWSSSSPTRWPTEWAGQTWILHVSWFSSSGTTTVWHSGKNSHKGVPLIACLLGPTGTVPSCRPLGSDAIYPPLMAYCKQPNLGRNFNFP